MPTHKRSIEAVRTLAIVEHFIIADAFGILTIEMKRKNRIGSSSETHETFMLVESSDGT